MTTRDPGKDPILDLSGDLDGLPADLSEKFDHYLDQTYDAELGKPERPAQC